MSEHIYLRATVKGSVVAARGDLSGFRAGDEECVWLRGVDEGALWVQVADLAALLFRHWRPADPWLQRAAAVSDAVRQAAAAEARA